MGDRRGAEEVWTSRGLVTFYVQFYIHLGPTPYRIGVNRSGYFRLAPFRLMAVEDVTAGVTPLPMTGPVTEKYDTLIAEGSFPTRRWGLPEDVARVVSSFGRGDLDYSTGQKIEVGGGFGINRL